MAFIMDVTMGTAFQAFPEHLPVSPERIDMMSPPPRPKIKYVPYIERYKENGTSFQHRGFPLKANRLSNKEGTIILEYLTPVADSIQVAIESAKMLWEAIIPAKAPIYILVEFCPLEDDIPMYTEVGIYAINSYKGCPGALAAQFNNREFSGEEAADGLIVLNSDIEWNCSFSGKEATGYNLPTMVLRGLARCYGFGSTIENNDLNPGGYHFYHDYPAYFDSMLYHNDISLPDAMTDPDAVADFVTADNVYVRTFSQSYKIYNPKTFVNGLSLCYFDNQNSLMSYSIGNGSVYLTIDECTADVLRTMGWQIPQSGAEIICDDISDNGIGSSYKPHTFSLSESRGTISEYRWSFSLKDSNGDYTPVSQGTGDSFSIPAIPDADNYHVNINGDLEGRIECEYTMDGVSNIAIPFKLSLERKPTILSIDNVNVIHEDPGVFSLLFNVSYAGADNLYVEIEEEYNTSLRSYRFDEPYIAHVKTGNITSFYKSWVTVEVSNKYGTASRTLVFDPVVYAETNCGTSDISSIPSLNDDFPVRIQLYDTVGRCVFTGEPSDLLTHPFTPGTYIKIETHENEESRISKIRL